MGFVEQLLLPVFFFNWQIRFKRIWNVANTTGHSIGIHGRRAVGPRKAKVSAGSWFTTRLLTTPCILLDMDSAHFSSLSEPEELKKNVDSMISVNIIDLSSILTRMLGYANKTPENKYLFTYFLVYQCLGAILMRRRFLVLKGLRLKLLTSFCLKNLKQLIVT